MTNVIVERVNVFPQEFLEFKFSTELITPLYNEVLEKKDEIKRISDHLTNSQPDYWTDYSQPVKLNGWEKLLPHVKGYFSEFEICTCDGHWTAIYGKHGMHGLHAHTESLFQPKINNFSCILYLTNVGSTTFLNPNTHNITEFFIDVKAQQGKLIMFPSNIIHTSNPHNLDREKIIISANWQIISNV